MIFECLTIINGEEKTFLVQATSFSMAENEFSKKFNKNELRSICKSDSMFLTDIEPASEQHNRRGRIGFANTDSLEKQCRHSQLSIQATEIPTINFY